MSRKYALGLQALGHMQKAAASLPDDMTHRLADCIEAEMSSGGTEIATELKTALVEAWESGKDPTDACAEAMRRIHARRLRVAFPQPPPLTIDEPAPIAFGD